MRRISFLALLTLVMFTSSLPLAAFATPAVLPTQVVCPTYLTNLTVDYINSTPNPLTVNGNVTTMFQVVYPDGTPVQLSPETGSFLWVGAAGQKEFDNVPVTYTGKPGYYNYTQTLTSDIVQAALGSNSTGKITVQVVNCSLSDASGNRGPTGNIGSDETLITTDNSNLNVAPQTPTQQPISYLVPLIIAILIILAILLFLRRSRTKKK